jgi:nucleoside-diphosphate-sugar epimerase
MAWVVIIGGSGHVGTYLVPRLVEAGYDVINVTREQSKPYLPHAAWNVVQRVQIDREQAEQDGSFGQQIADLKPDVVIDMVCFRLSSAQHIVEALRGQVQHFLHCGTIWVHGSPVQQPTTEDAPRRPLIPPDVAPEAVEEFLKTNYGAQKAAIEAYLLDEARRNRFPVTLLHPGHIVGPGHHPINPQGNKNPQVFEKLAAGEPLLLPHFGLETVHHVHADDVAQAFVCALQHWSESVGEAFHTLSPAALTLRGFAEAVAGWFDQEARLEFLGWNEFRQRVSASDAQATWDHIAHSPNGSIAKAQRLLGYQPRYTSLQAVYESLQWLIANGEVKAPAL